jgi:hypothetical protein
MRLFGTGGVPFSVVFIFSGRAASVTALIFEA